MKRWPAFSLVEMAVILMITGVLLARLPAVMNFYKTYETKQQIDLAIKSLGAHVAKAGVLPAPDPPRRDETWILRGTLPYKTLGIRKKGPIIQYAVDRILTEPKVNMEKTAGFYDLSLENHFAMDCPPQDLIAFELSVDGRNKEILTRNNFAAQYCGVLCRPTLRDNNSSNNMPAIPTPRPTIVKESGAKLLSPEERDALAKKSG